MLAKQLDTRKVLESSFVLDFSRQEELEKLQEEVAFKEEISKQLDELISNAPRPSSSYKNLAVDRSSLRDDRNTDADQLYKDAARLAAELENGKSAIEEDYRSEAVDLKPSKDSGEGHQKEYSGPSVVSYFLDGRKSVNLRIPAYRCMGEGRVTVIICVDRSGRVLDAKIADGQSSTDNCLRNYAKQAARLSRFSASETAVPKQMGEITYEFIAQ